MESLDIDDHAEPCMDDGDDKGSRFWPPSAAQQGGGSIMRAAGENFARGGVKMAISFGKKRGER